MTKFQKGGQEGWYHQDGNPYGYFHTYNALDISETHIKHKIHILLPYDYETSPDIYPVIYLNDGETCFWNHGYATWNIPQTLMQENVAKSIIIGIVPSNRNYEYTSTFWCEGEDFGGLPQYSEYVALFLKQWIDNTYRTKPESINTMIIGASHGGLASFYIANKYPDAFGYVGCFSPSFWAAYGPEVIVGFGDLSESLLIDDLKSTLKDKTVRPKAWIDWGLKRDGLEHNDLVEHTATIVSKRFIELLRKEFGYEDGVDLFWFEDELGGHDEMAWAYRFKLVMEYFFSKE